MCVLCCRVQEEMMMKLAVLLILSAAVAVQCAAVAEVKHYGGITHQRMLSSKTKTKMGQPTDPPVEQATEVLISFTDYCTSDLELTASSVHLYSGEWISPPPPIIGAWSTGQNRLGLGAKKATSTTGGTTFLNGTFVYTSKNFKGYPVSIMFLVVQGEWMLEASYATFLDLQILNADIGDRAVYNLVIGHKDWLNVC